MLFTLVNISKGWASCISVDISAAEPTYLQHILHNIEHLVEKSHHLLKDFTNKKRKSPYHADVNNFANHLEEIKQNILHPINHRIALEQHNCSSSFYKTLQYTQEIVKELSTKFTEIHQVLQKYQMRKKKIVIISDAKAFVEAKNLCQDLEKPVNNLTSAAMINKLDKKLSDIQSLVSCATIKHKITQLKTLLKNFSHQPKIKKLELVLHIKNKLLGK